MSETQIIQKETPFAMSSWEDMERMANQVAKSGMFGINNPAQAICLFAIAQSEGINALAVLRKYHVIEGKPSMRADAMLAEFLRAGGGVIYHIRTDKIVAATYFADKKRIDPAAEKRANERMEIIISLEMDEKLTPEERKQKYLDLIKLNKEGEVTIVRSFADAKAKGITEGRDGTKANWLRYPRAMLSARCDTEGIRIIMPGLIAGIMETSEAVEVAETETFHVKQIKDASPEELQRQIDEYVTQAMSATGLRKSELLGKAAEIRQQLYELQHGKGAPVEDAIPMETVNYKREEENPDDYCIEHVGGLYRGMLAIDIDVGELELIVTGLERKVAKKPEVKYELEMLRKVIARKKQNANDAQGEEAEGKNNKEEEAK